MIGSDEITGLSINKQSNSAVYVQWADVNPTVPQYRIRLWYNGNLRLDKILSGQDARNNYYIWYIDYPPYALMPGDVIKAEVTPYAGGIAVSNPYTASATIQATPNSQEPIAVTPVIPVQNTPPPVFQPPGPPVRVTQPPPDTYTGLPSQQRTVSGIGGWIKSHVLLSIGILGAGVVMIHNKKKS